ncbi:DNA methyltransferase [Mycoplasmoides pirum]|uniref:DNA methyltransferase n=1 Tax=Mycoplasmoides pirum TaxID=2122 RepID=UPI0009DCB9FF|nr:DNA methyltransferase [Mycoplasmoides pirum]
MINNKKIKKENIEVNRIYNKNCLDIINSMIKQNFIVDAIITDPPYNVSKKNNFKTIGRLGVDFGKWDKNFNQTLWLNNIGKILKPGGSIIIFNDWKNLGIISQELVKENFEIKDLLRWIKPNPMPRNVDRRYVPDYEFALWAIKKKGSWTFNKKLDKFYLKPEFICPSVSSKKRIHPTEKPLILMEEIIKIHTNEGDIVFDPFSGSGSTLVAANKLNRFYIGSEILKSYYNKSIKRIKESYIKPTFNHLGNKFRMIEDLIRNFPKNNVDYFVDVFAGSGVVSLNYQTPKKIFLNDKDKWLTAILNYLMNTDVNLVIQKTENIIKQYKLPVDKLNDKYTSQYNKLKKDFNRNKNVEKLLVLILFGFNQQIRFNSKDEWNIPAGKFRWSLYQKNKLIEFCEKAKEKNYSIHSKEFDIFVYEILKEIDKKKTLFYFDPPYLISDATYNNSWTELEEQKLIDILNFLTKNGYRWCLSNLLYSKGKENTKLNNFISINKKNIKVDIIKNISYKNSNYQRKKNFLIDQEILIRGNYE